MRSYHKPYISAKPCMHGSLLGLLKFTVEIRKMEEEKATVWSKTSIISISTFDLD